MVFALDVVPGQSAIRERICFILGDVVECSGAEVMWAFGESKVFF